MNTIESPAAEANLRNFYSGGKFVANAVVASGGNAQVTQQAFGNKLDVHAVTHDAVAERLATIAVSHSVYEQDGYRIGVTVLNPEATSDKTRVFGATFRAAMDNEYGAGNAVEQAVRFELYWASQAAEGADAERTVYLGFPYNGSNSPLSAKEIGYFRKTGRFTYEDDQTTRAIPYYEAAAKVLTRQLGLEVGELMADSAGAIGMPALGVAVGATGSIERYFANGRPQLASLSRLAIFRAQLQESLGGKELYDRLKIDTLRRPSETWKQQIRELNPAVFRDDRPMLHGRDLLAVANGLRRGPEDGDPLVTDLSAFARTHPQARISMVHGMSDHFTGPHYDLSRAERIASLLSRASDNKVQLVGLPGQSHSWHTYLPALYNSVYMQSRS